jgi:sigma-B regulation protein RsbU (phosphoserine phosphatase)
VADASGKGVPASLLISGLRTSIRETVRPGLSLADAVSHINRAVHETTQVGHFIAAFLGVYDPRTGELEYCVAGIESPFWVRPRHGRVERLHRGGPVLGIEPDAHFRSGIVTLEPGDRVLAYSDGVTDQVDSSEEPFGADRLQTIARSEDSGDAKQLLEAVFRALQAFRGDEIVDDTTLLILRRSRNSSVGMKSAS